MSSSCIKYKRGFKAMNKLAQIWVETVIYTLIGLVIIGTTLAFVKPKIQEVQDQAVIEQTIEIMRYIDSVVSEITRGGEGNTRIVEIGIKKGNLKFDSNSDSIIFTLSESKSMYSEPGRTIKDGNINILTEKKGSKVYDVTLTLDYTNKYNLQYDNSEVEAKTITKAPIPYKVKLENNGVEPSAPADTPIKININVVS